MKIKLKFSGFLILFLSLLLSENALSIVKKDVQSLNEKKKEVSQKLGKILIPFIENQGQVSKEVKFYAKTFGGTVFITQKSEIVYNLPSKDRKITVIRETLFNSKPNSIQGLKKAEAKVNYFIGNDKKKWKTGIPTYNLVSLGEVYKGVELKLKAHGNNVEKLFFVKPGSEVSQIKLKIDGAKNLKIDKQGHLEVETQLGIVKFTKPVAFQEINGKKVKVAVEYQLLSKNSYSFKVGKYNKNKELIIDPLLASTYLGGSDSDRLYAIALDSSGNVVVAGWSNSSDYFIYNGMAYNANADVVVTKLTNDLGGVVLGSTFIGGSSDERAFALAIDSSDNIFVTGYTYSNDYPMLGTHFDNSYNGNVDIFVTKLSNDLQNIIASTYIGGNTRDKAYGIAIDSSDNVFITGFASGIMDYPTTAGAYDTTPKTTFLPYYETIVSKLSNNLSQLLASTYLSGNDPNELGEQKGNAIAIDSSGNVYVAGYSQNTDYPTTTGAYDSSHNGGFDAVVSVLNNDLSSLIASTYVGSSGDDVANGITLDSSKNIYITGYTSNSNYPVTTGATLKGSRDIIVSKFSNDLKQLSASTMLGSTGSDEGHAIAVDSSNNVYITGYAGNSDYPTTEGTYSNGKDVVVTKLDSNLSNILASRFLGGWDNDEAPSIVLDSSNNVYIAGYTSSADYPTTAGAFEHSYNGGITDGFVSKLNLTTYLLTVNKSGSGTGIVVDSESGIYCGDDCNEKYNPSTKVELYAFSDSNSVFAGWGGDCSSCGSLPTCKITMNSDKTCSATFNPKSSGTVSYSLIVTKTGNGNGTVTSSPSGINCGIDCSENYTSGTNVQLTAAPDTGSVFTGWSGSCSYCGSAQTCTISLDSNKTCSATFNTESPNNTPVINSFNANPTSGDKPLAVSLSWDISDADGDTLTCQIDVNNDGTAEQTINNCTNSSNFSYTYNNAGTYTAKLNVTDGNGGIARETVNVVVNEPSASVSYALTITKTGTGNGSVTSSPSGINCGTDCSENYNSGTDVQLTAAPDTGSVFAGWSGDCSSCGSALTCSITINSDKVCSATFNTEAANNAPVIKSFNANKITGDKPLSVDFNWEISDVDGDTLTCQIDTNDDGTPEQTINNCDNSSSFNYTYNLSGTYIAKLTITDGKGGIDRETIEIIVSKKDSDGGCSMALNPISLQSTIVNILTWLTAFGLIFIRRFRK